MDNISQKLKDWRDRTANKEGVELYRVLSNTTITLIANLKPKTKDELITIKGIKEKKFAKYGKDILNLVNNKIDCDINQHEENKENIYTVDSYLNLLNSNFRDSGVKIIGEVSSIEIRQSYLFFSLKDEKNMSMINCFMWRRNYDLYNIDIVEGVKIIVNGHPEVYKPSGRLSFMSISIELVGEGAIKKAYDELKKKLTNEGIFAIEKKKKIPIFPKEIGLITSETGAVIHDFLNNIGKHGYKITFVDSRVEGQIAVSNLISAIDYFSDKNIDVLVIIRGGGSLESLQAFNNEKLVRKIADFEKPIICGIGHDKDMPIASMAADVSVSTPTAVAGVLDESFDKTLRYIAIFEKNIFYSYQEIIINVKDIIEDYSKILNDRFRYIIKIYEELVYRFSKSILIVGYNIESTQKTIREYGKYFIYNFEKIFKETNIRINNIQVQIKNNNPIRQLKLGYSIVSFNKKIVSKISQIKKNDIIDISISDGIIKSKVDKIINKNFEI